MAVLTKSPIKFKTPVNLNSQEFNDNKYAYYEWLQREAPVTKGRIAVIGGYFLSRYDDCVSVLKDPRFVRNRTTVTGGGRSPFPLPRNLELLAKSMITEDDPEHRRLRTLVHKAFTPRSLGQISGRVEQLTHELLDAAEAKGEVDLMQAYSLPIPVTVISEMLGVDPNDTAVFSVGMKALTEGMTGWNFFRAIFWDIPKMTKFMAELIEKKRGNPGDDILTNLIQAEEGGEKLSEDELISMSYLLIIAGYETTVHLINNAVITLLQHPDELQRLRDNPDLMDSAVEEVLRFNGPIHGTKPQYATEDVTIRGVTIPKKSIVIPLLGAANRDPDVFENPHVFDIGRTPNRHLGFGQGIHYCLGAPLARIETKIALKNLLERNPNLRLANPDQLALQKMMLWHRHGSVPVIMG